MKWERTQEGPYVDVAGFAEGVVGFSSEGSDQYATDFGGTAAAASIAAGVASLLKAENPGLSGEDIDEILEITARDAGAPGRDDATGAGAIDAGAALAFVRGSDVQRATVPVDRVRSDQTMAEAVQMNRSTGFTDYAGPNCYAGGINQATPRGDLHKFKARIDFDQSFSSTPEAWVRWGQSDGISARYGQSEGDPIAFYDPTQKGLEVVSVNETGMVVEGFYWETSFYNQLGQKCDEANIPSLPGGFQIAYTAIGTEGAPPPPPLTASVSGPSTLATGQTATFRANASGGDGSSVSYQWYRKDEAFSNYIPVGSDAPTYSYTWIRPGQHHIKVEVTQGNKNASDEMSVRIIDGGDCGPSSTSLAAGDSAVAKPTNAPLPCSSTASAMSRSFGSARAVPEAYALHGNAPNPFREQTAIRYALPEATDVEIVVYDAIGREVARPVEGRKPAGFHAAAFKAERLSSGVYFYRMKAGDFTGSGSMVVVK